ncbi:hypothetical protein HN011_003409 [Eciton burchellii]|nr:hypothetical protein HN011_003409 [Eciton burchellii]
MPITWNRYNTCDVNVPERAAFFPRLARMSIKCQCPGSLIRIDLWSAVKGLYSNYFRDTEILIDSIMGTTIAGNRLSATRRLSQKEDHQSELMIARSGFRETSRRSSTISRGETMRSAEGDRRR